jgi:hypothetical protein
LKFTVTELAGAWSPASESLALEAAVCGAFDGPLSDAGSSSWFSLMPVPKTGDGSVRIGVGVGTCSDSDVVVNIDVVVDGNVGPEGDSAMMPGARLVGETGFGLAVDQNAGWSDERLGGDNGAAFVADVPAEDAGAAKDNAGIGGAWFVGAWIVGAW